MTSACVQMRRKPMTVRSLARLRLVSGGDDDDDDDAAEWRRRWSVMWLWRWRRAGEG